MGCITMFNNLIIIAGYFMLWHFNEYGIIGISDGADTVAVLAVFYLIDFIKNKPYG